jgi:hypothetical protein
LLRLSEEPSQMYAAALIDFMQAEIAVLKKH